jgi:hypothetical protein
LEPGSSALHAPAGMSGLVPRRGGSAKLMRWHVGTGLGECDLEPALAHVAPRADHVRVHGDGIGSAMGHHPVVDVPY